MRLSMFNIILITIRPTLLTIHNGRHHVAALYLHTHTWDKFIWTIFLIDKSMMPVFKFACICYDKLYQK